MTGTVRPTRTPGPLAQILRIGAPDVRRFLLGTALGTAAALCTVGLLACSGALIDKAALRPPLYTLTLLMAAVQLLALGGVRCATPNGSSPTTPHSARSAGSGCGSTTRSPHGRRPGSPDGETGTCSPGPPPTWTSSRTCTCAASPRW